jgi:sterol desaturase/sphingolipid hydroxylase (fatty acid hydroxylase superfamily)
MHKIHVLWRIHAIHHSDEKVSALTGLLHHPAEALVSYFLILVLGILVGLPMVALVIYGFVSALHNAFVHADVTLPKRLDRILRTVIVTPSMHRTHHLASAREGDSNFGQIFSIWDRIFRTCVSDADLSGKLGLPSPERPKSFTVLGLMAHPFERRL